jgi:hypothetical protein
MGNMSASSCLRRKQLDDDDDDDDDEQEQEGSCSSSASKREVRAGLTVAHRTRQAEAATFEPVGRKGTYY